MRDEEEKYEVLLTKNMNDEKKLAWREKKKAFYERFINDPAISRAPATNGK
jgi:hypothetical protein